MMRMIGKPAIAFSLCLLSVSLCLCGETHAQRQDLVLFAFDDQSFQSTDNLQLTMVAADKHPANPVLRCGPEGAPDHGHAIIYGSVLKIGDKFRMWYLGMPNREIVAGQAPGYWRPMCYAESADGVAWTKPELGLVEFNGSKQNNICLIETADPADAALTRVDDFLTVVYEPDAPPGERYKSAFIAHVPWDEVKGGVRDVGSKERRLCAAITAVSADGLRWRVLGDRPAVNEKFEVSGLYRFAGRYFIAGQQLSPWSWLPDGRSAGRVMTVFESPDFKTWSTEKTLGFARPGQLANPPIAGQQTHMGAGLWNRGNVLVGLYGMWQDGPPERPKGSSHLYGMRMDLGLVVSNDGRHFREPAPGFKTIPRGEEGKDWDCISLLQGHAFANVGDKTYLWYSHWDSEGKFRSQEIGLATLRRDGFGYLSNRNPAAVGKAVVGLQSAFGWTCYPAVGTAPPPRGSLYINADGATKQKPLKLELLGGDGQSLLGYTSKLTHSGLHEPIAWDIQDSATNMPFEAASVRLTFPAGGETRVYALYVR